MQIIMNDTVFIKKSYHISTDKNLLDIDVIYTYLDQESYWAKGIPMKTLEKAVANSLCFGVYRQKQQVGFARVITDEATFAYLCDVFIIPAERGKGLSKWLIQTIKHNPSLQGLRRWSLATADAQGLYSQFGFTPISHPDRWMEIFTPYQIDGEIT